MLDYLHMSSWTFFRAVLGSFGLWLLLGGAVRAEASEAPAASEVKSLVIYSSQKEHILRELVESFSQETGVQIRLVYDQAGPLLTKLRAEGASSPADVLLAVDVGNLWLATQMDLLRPIQSEDLTSAIPNVLRDSQGRWFGLSQRARTIVYNPDQVAAEDLGSYADLAGAQWKGRLCLRTSGHVYNQSLVAVLLESLGEDKTLEVLRGWVRNLAAPVFANDTQLIRAVHSGQCHVGITNSYYLARILSDQPDIRVQLHWPERVHVNVFGGGVTRSSSQPDLGQQFLEWLVSESGQKLIAQANYEFPVREGIEPSQIVKSWGVFQPMEVHLSVAGERQSEAVRLMDRARYR